MIYLVFLQSQEVLSPRRESQTVLSGIEGLDGRNPPSSRIHYHFVAEDSIYRNTISFCRRATQYAFRLPVYHPRCGTALDGYGQLLHIKPGRRK